MRYIGVDNVIVKSPIAYTSKVTKVTKVYSNKVLDITLKYFVEQTLSVYPEEYCKPFHDFKDRYLEFEK